MFKLRHKKKSNNEAYIQYRIIHAPTDLGMRGYSLCKAERALGLDSRQIVRRKGVHVSGFVDELQSSNKLIYLFRLSKALMQMLVADVIVFNSGRSLLDFTDYNLPLLDLPIWSLLGKRVVVTYQGCDVRPCCGCPVRDAITDGMPCRVLAKNLTYDAFDAAKKIRLRKFRKYAHVLLGITPDLCQVEGIVYSPHAKSLSANSLAVTPFERAALPLRIGHMPKNHIKGSEQIEPIILSLCEQYPDKYQYVPITGLPWKEALEELKSCHIVVDQILMGWYGGISVESALLGVPSVAQINSELLKFIPEPMRNDLPVILINDISELSRLLEHFAKDRKALDKEALRCNRSARKWHDAQVVARDMIQDHYCLDVSVPAMSR